MIVRILFLLLSLASVYTQNEPSCSGQTCTVATPVTLSKETTWTGDGEELVISGAITCSDENTKTDCSLKALNYKSVKIDAAVDVARLEIEASSQISVNKDVIVMRGGSDPSPKTGGAAHGGDGSGVTTDSPGNQGYGNAIIVNTAGKRGGGTDDALGGNGGGFIRLVAPTVTLAAKLIADGDSATTMNRGGGSGGGVFVRATSSLDFGLGAAVSAKGAGGPGGAGGGGRVALIYGNSTTLRVEAVDVSGGPAMTNQKNGGSGTVYIRGGTTDQLLVKAAALDGLTTEFTSIILEDEPVGDISLNNVVVRGEDVDNDAVKWLINGTLSLTSAKIIATTVDVEAGGGLIIDELSSIDVSKRVTDMKSPGAGVNTTEASSGGSHAGVGGKGSAKDAAEPHGTASQPLSLGGPGGGGAAGGGAVRIVVDGAVMIDGAVNADGESVTEGNGGGGAGGSIWISAGETFAGKGLLSASGGASSGGGGGGGGRVRVEREQNAVKELAMRPPVPSTGIIDYTAPPPPAPLKTLLPAMLQWNVDGGVGVNIVGNDTTDGDLSTEATVRGGSGTMAAALGLQGTRLLIESDKPKQMPTLFGPGDASFGYVELIQVTLQTGAGGALAVGGAMLLDRVELRDDTEISLSGAHLRMQRTTIVAPIVKIAATSLYVASDATLQTLPSDKCPVGANTNGADGVRAGGGGARGGVGDDAGERDAGSNSRIPSGGSADSASNVVDVIRPALCGGRGGSVGPMVNKTRNIVAKGGLGGGVVSIDLLGDLQFEGKIIANGSPPEEHEEEDVAPGSGAGGSVYVRARRVLGAGSIEANGAAAVGAGGAGGGGRVAFAYVSEVSGNLTVSIKGGAPGTGSAVVPRAGGMGTLARIQELLATGSPAVERRFPTLLIAGGGSGVPSTTSVQPTYVPAQPTGDASVLKTIHDERWTKITIRNAVAALPDKEPGVDTEQFEMISSVVKQQQVYVTVSKLATIDSMSLIDVSASVETAANNIGNAVGAGYGGNGAGPLNSTAVQYGYGSVTPGVGRAGGDHVTNGTTDVRGGYGGGAVHLLGKEQAVWTINGKITADGEKAQFGKQKASGGGSGGGVLIAGLVINGTGTVSADGGSGFQSGGAGGGGRLALHNYSSVDSALKLSVAPGAAVTGGMQAGYGTVYRVPLGTPEDEGTLELVGPAEGTVLTSRYNKAAGTSWPVNGVAKANVVVKRTFIDGRANGNFALTTSGNVTLDNGIIEASVIAINAHSLILSGNALVSTTALGTKTADKVANTNLTFSYVFGGGGGSHAGYGISPTSGTEVTGHTVSQPYPDILVIGADNKAAKDNGNFRQPNTFGLAGGLAHPPNNIADYPETEPQLGGASGGIIKIVLKGKLSVGATASIDADGGQPSVSKTRACSLGPYDPDPAKCGQMRDVALVGGGAGSGGSVWIEADVIEGEGIISANGGSTTPTKGRATTDKLAVTSPGGAGGGGRLAIYYNTLARDKLKLQAMGGRSLEGTAYGTAGTIYLSSTQTYTEELRFDNAHSRLVVTWPGSPLPEAKAAAPLQRLVVTGSANVWIPAVGNAFTSVVVGELTVESKSKIGGKRVILLSEVIKVRDGSQLFGSDLRVSALTVEIDGKTSLITATAAGLAPAAQNGADAAGVEGGGGGGGATGAGATCGSQAGGLAAAKPAMDPVPYLHGGNGGAASSLSGGRGGGVVSLDVYGKLTMKDGGGVTADGNPGGASATTQQGGGGGGGGTVEIIINAPIEGMGVLLARGGDGPATGGDGGGGVVRIVHPTFSDVNDLSNVQMDADPQGSNDGCLSEKGAIVFVASRENRRRFVCGGGRYDTNSTMPPYTCEQCAKGTAAPRVGSFECGVCPPGTFAKELGTVACIPCFAGSFSNTNRTVECTPCEAGEEQPARGKQSCADCKVGTAAPSPGTAECGACAPGLYQDETGQETCKQCEIGFSTLGKSRATTCTRCDAGFEAPKKGHPTCDECGPGYFSELVDSVPSPVCQACSMGQFARFAGSDACELCPARTFSGTAGASECELCGVGEYVEAKGQAACVRCPVGTFADEVGTLRCQTCPPDTFQSEEGSTACEKCPAGTFTECANFVSDETCAAPCHWLASGAGGQCVTRECAVCVDASSPDCKRWDTFAPEYSIVTGEALTCGCVVTGETYTVTMRAKTGLNETLSMGGLLGNITFGVTANTGRKRSILEAPITNSKDNGDGTYSFDFTIDEAGTYMLVLEYQGEPIADSPYTFDVTQAAFPTWAIVLIAVGAGCCCLGLIAAAVVLMRKKGMCEGGGGGGNYNTTEMSSGTFNKKKALTPELRSFEIQIQDLTFDKEIGRGAFGVVYKGTWRDSNVAIKQLLLEETSGAVFERELKTFQDEALTMSTMRPHVNVVLLLGITPAPNLCIVVEFCEGGSLYSKLRGNENMTGVDQIHYCKGIASGMSHLHAENIIHRDLAARNILLDGGNNAKVSDFGLSRRCFGEVENQTKSDVGPLKWMAPEAIKNRIYSQRSDVWSYGVTIWEIIAREDPYPDMDALQVASRVCFNGLRLEKPYSSPPILSEIMDMCFQTEAANRPNFRQICQKFAQAGL